MTIGDHLETFGGLSVVFWRPGDPLPDPAVSMPKFGFTWEDEDFDMKEALDAYLALEGAEQTRGVVIGVWDEEMFDVSADTVVDLLVAAREKLPNLRVLFIGDVTFEENEISWIINTDQSRLYQAYPDLEHVGIRGGNDLALPGLNLPKLRTLVIETGGMDQALMAQVLEAQLPELTHLELYTGSEDYGANTEVADLASLLTGGLFPELTYLGVRNCEYTDAFCRAIVGSPLLDRLEVLDLSLGTLTDEGARVLADSPGIRKLRRLDVHHHYLTEEGQRLLTGLGIPVDVSEPQTPDEFDGEVYYSVAIGE